MTKKERVAAAIRHQVTDRVPKGELHIEGVKRKFGDKLCLWRNLDLDYTMCFGSPKEVRESVKDTIRKAGENGGYILSTCNSMISSIPNENIFAMIEASEAID